MGLELELLPSHHRLPLIRTTAAAPPTPQRPGGGSSDNGADVDGGCATPKSVASALPAPSTCPPAPRKPRPAKRKQLPTTTHHHRQGCSCAAPHPAPVRWFIAVPQDVLAAVFVARTSPAPCPTSSPASKKIRVHVVG